MSYSSLKYIYTNFQQYDVDNTTYKLQQTQTQSLL